MPSEEKKKHINDATAPIVSVITPLYNSENFIAETIASIQQQSFRDWELIIVDDASTDASLTIAEAAAEKDPRIKVLALPLNKGAAFCRNHATNEAKGGFIAFLDADDLWHPEKLERQLSFMQRTYCDVSYTNYLHIDEVGNSLNKRIMALPQLTYSKQHKNNYIGNLTGIYNAARLGKIHAPPLRKRQDWALWLEAIRRSEKPALGLQKDLAYYRVRKGSISAGKIWLIRYNYQFYKSYLGYNPVKAAFHLGLFFMEYFFIRPKYIQKAD